MNIAGTEFNLNRGALEVYVAGCALGCIDCHNPALQDFNYGVPIREIQDKIVEQLKQPIVKQLWLLGGEPQHQDKESLCSFMEEICKIGKSTVLFTGLNFVDVSLVKYFDFIKLGAFWGHFEAYTEPVLGLHLASNNQHVITQQEAKERYAVYNS